MSSRATDHLEPSAKKRGNDRQRTKDDDTDDDEQQEAGVFQRASDEVLKQRKIVRARRPGSAAASGDAAKSTVAPGGANPFAGVSLAAATPAPTAANPFAGVSLAAAAPAPAAVNPFAGVSLAANPSVGPSPAPPTVDAAKAPADEGGADEGEVGAGEGKEGVAALKGSGLDAAEGPAPTEEASAKKPDAEDPAAERAAGKEPAVEEPTVEKAEGEVVAQAGAKSIFGGSLGGGFGSLASASAPSISFAPAPASSKGGLLAFGGGAPAFSFGGTTSGGFGALKAADSGGGLAFGGGNRAGDGDEMGRPSDEDAGERAGAAGASAGAGGPVRASLPPSGPIETGEEGERTVFSCQGTLFEFTEDRTWKERGRGEARVNAPRAGVASGAAGRPARIVMRAKGNLRLILNAALWPEMPLARMEGGKGATFAAINAIEGGGDETAATAGDRDGAATASAEAEAEAAAAAPASPHLTLSTYALRVKSPEDLEALIAAFEAHKGSSSPNKGPEAQEA